VRQKTGIIKGREIAEKVLNYATYVMTSYRKVAEISKSPGPLAAIPTQIRKVPTK
jgi:hypothetical protein